MPHRRDKAHAPRRRGPLMRWHRRRTGEQYDEHRAIAEWMLDHHLRPGEIVHHRNGDRHDNHPDHLDVLPDQRIRAPLRYLERREARGQQQPLERSARPRDWRSRGDLR